MSDWMKTLKVGDKVAIRNKKSFLYEQSTYDLHEVTRVSGKSVWILFFGTETRVAIATQKVSGTSRYALPVTENILAEIARYNLVRLVENALRQAKLEDMTDDELRHLLKVLVDAEVRRCAT